MAEIRLAKAATELNVSREAIVESLQNKGFSIENKPTSKLTEEMYDYISSVYSSDKEAKLESKLKSNKLKKKEEIAVEEQAVNNKKVEEIELEIESEPVVFVKNLVVEPEPIIEPDVEKQPEPIIETKVETPEPIKETKTEEVAEKESSRVELSGITIKGKIDLDANKKKSKKDPESKIPEKKVEIISPKAEPIIETPQVEVIKVEDVKIEEPEERELVKAKLEKLDGLTIMGKIVIKPEVEIKSKYQPSERLKGEKRKRKVVAQKVNIQQEIKVNKSTQFKKEEPKKEISQKEVQDKLKKTLNKIDTSGRGKTNKSKFKRTKRAEHFQARVEEKERMEQEEMVLKVTEFLTANDLAKLMNASVTQVISTCFSLGIMVSINQRLDAETIALVADEFGFEVEFVDAGETIQHDEEQDDPAKLVPRPPIVTVMGHVDHGKTSLLDYVRKTNVIAGEAGGITQHIGAYEVQLASGQKMTFLDTPGHEAFTAMRARGAKVTDIAIIMIAADDSIMPQTREAISHAQAAGVPMVFAINKIDKPGANPEKIREELSAMNILAEEWGGKFQTQEISAKQGLNIDKLLEKVLLEAEFLDLKADPTRHAKGTVIEARLDKGRGIVASVLIQTGTLRVGDHLVAGSRYAKVKALFNERNQKVDFAGPATPVSMLGFSDSPSAGDPLIVMATEDEAKDLANRREQLLREQGIRTTKHITLDEIGRRLAVGNFKELNLIVKGDVNGSVEALSDSLLNLTNEEVMVNIIHKGVGQITESDVLLASASDAIIIGFQVRPSSGAKKIADTEQIDIRHYSIIYQAIDEIKSAIEGMLSPEIKETIIGNVEVREVFKITKVGTVAGCMVTDGKVTRNSKLRVIRDGVVVHQGSIDTLKRFKDDVKDVLKGFECGLQIKNYQDIHVGDNLEIFEETSIARKLE
ncbi:MAG: translation initiation factor IF-2 [Bacteroidota bacterium]|nr:translation initiation factor IF-2 [Bacteroidota bacterium]